MAERASAIDRLAALLQQLRLQQADGKLPSEVTQAQVDLLLARIASLTEALRGAAEQNATFRVGARLLLADVAMVAAQFRGNTNAFGERLTRALESAQQALDRPESAPAPER